MSEAQRRWQPVSREQFLQLRRLQRLQDRGGRVWTNARNADPFQHEGMAHVIVRAGDVVRQVSERFTDDYMLLEVQELSPESE